MQRHPGPRALRSRLGLLVVGMVATSMGCDGKRSELPAPSGSATATAAAQPSGDCATRDSVTCFVASDTHFGFSAEVEAKNDDAIRQMNEMAGKPWPEALDNTIDAPYNIIMTDNLTENGKPDE